MGKNLEFYLSISQAWQQSEHLLRNLDLELEQFHLKVMKRETFFKPMDFNYVGHL